MGTSEKACRRFWADSVGFRAGDSAFIARYAAVRQRHFDELTAMARLLAVDSLAGPMTRE
jgi:hypothetical protein